MFLFCSLFRSAKSSIFNGFIIHLPHLLHLKHVVMFMKFSKIWIHFRLLIVSPITLFGHKIVPAVQKSTLSLHSDDISKISKKRKHDETVGDVDNMKGSNFCFSEHVYLLLFKSSYCTFWKIITLWNRLLSFSTII